MPQLAMLNHAAWAERENGERRYEAKKKLEEQREELDPVLPKYGKRLSEIEKDPELYNRYLMDWDDFA